MMTAWTVLYGNDMTKFARHFSGVASFSYRPYKDDLIRISKSSAFVIVCGVAFSRWDWNKDFEVFLQ